MIHFIQLTEQSECSILRWSDDYNELISNSKTIHSNRIFTKKDVVLECGLATLIAFLFECTT